MTDPAIAAWSRESDLLFALRQLREENELLKKKEWVGLTGEELQEIYQSAGTVHFKFAMVEAKLKEKNT